MEFKEQEAYRWFVTLVVDPDRPSHDVVAGGMIERISFDEACAFGMPCTWTACNREAIYRYSDSGLWYDAIACLLELIEHDDDKHDVAANARSPVKPDSGFTCRAKIDHHLSQDNVAFFRSPPAWTPTAPWYRIRYALHLIDTVSPIARSRSQWLPDKSFPRMKQKLSEVLCKTTMPFF